MCYLQLSFFIIISYQAKPTELKNTHGDSVKTPTYVDVELIAKKSL